MTGILGSGSNARTAVAAGTLQFQTSQQGGVIPLVYGTARVAPNLLDYADFTALPGPEGSKGGADAKAGGQFHYTASIVMGLCQGPINNFGLAWWNKSVAPLLDLPGLSFVAVGNDGPDQLPDPYWTANHPDHALNYSGLALFTADNYQLGDSPALPNFNVEIEGIATSSSFNGADASPAAIVTDFLTNPRYGANFPAANLADLTDYRDYCNAAGICLSPMLDQQQAAQQFLGMLAGLTNSAIVWSGSALKMIPYGDAPLSAGSVIVTISGTVAELDTLSATFTAAGLPGSPVTVTYQAQPASVNTDTVDYSSMAGGLAQNINGNSALNDFGITAGIGADAVVVALRGAAFDADVGVEASLGGGVLEVGARTDYSWTPNTTPLYSLGEDDFITQESSVGVSFGVTPGGAALRMGAGPVTGGFTDDPVQVQRSSPADAPNYVQLEVLDRANAYNTTIVEAFDQGAADLYGVRKDTSVKARAIVDFLGVGPIVAQLVLQRNLMFRNTYSFRLGWKYALLEPMDLVQITDARLGVSALTVRITAIAEDAEGTLAIEAEDWFGAAGPVLYPSPNPPPAVPGIGSLGQGAATANFYPRQGSAGARYAPNYNAPAPPTNAPFIIEPPGQLLAAQGRAAAQLWIGLSGGPGGVFSAVWGGAQIFASLDGESFGLQGSFSGQATMGVATGPLGGSADAVLGVDLGESAGQLVSVSAAHAEAGISLCALGSGDSLELVSFTTATLVSGNTYALSGLYRGLYGTTAQHHDAGAPFLYLGTGGYYAQILPAQYIGRPIYFKFPSFNLTGGGHQSLADAAVSEYTPKGGVLVPPGQFSRPVHGDTVTPSESR